MIYAISGALLLFVLFLLIRDAVATRTRKDLATAVRARKGFLMPPSELFLGGSSLRALAEACNDLVESSRVTKEAEANVRQRITATLTSIREAVLLIDEDNRVVLANDVLREFLGDNREVQGARLETLLHSARFLEFVRAIKSGARPRMEEIEIRREGKSLWFEVTGSQLDLEDPELGRLALLVLHDITQRKYLENMRSEFVANVSHELRTPVTVIKGFTETLIEDHREMPPERRQHFLQRIDRNVERLQILLEDLLSLTRIESGIERIYRKDYSISELARETRENFQARLKEGAVEVVLDLQPGNDIVRMDPLRITQVVENLLDNALRHARGMTKLILRTRIVEGGIQCMVEDDGCGIPERDLPHIFERFYRVDKGRSRESGGTGLGLSIVKHIIQQHGGLLLADSQERKGSSIGFFLPRNGGQENSQEDTPSEEVSEQAHR